MSEVVTKISSNVKRYQKPIIILVKVSIALLLVVYLIRHLNPNQIWKDLQSANIFIILSALLLLVLNLYLQYKKWQVVCNSVLQETDKKKILHSLFYGFSAGISTPMRIGEYVGRALPFKNKSAVEITIATFIDKLFSILIVLFLGAVTSILFIYYYFNISVLLTLSLFLALFIALYLIILVLNDSDFWKDYILKKIKKVKFLSKYYVQFESINELDSITIRKVTVLSVLFYFTYIFQFALLVYAFSNSLHLALYAWIGTMVMFSKKFISFLSIGDLGIREATAVYFAGILGVPEIAAFNASIFIFIINLVIPSLLGLFLIFKRNK